MYGQFCTAVDAKGTVPRRSRRHFDQRRELKVAPRPMPGAPCPGRADGRTESLSQTTTMGRVRLTNDTLNSYGYRVLTEGVDISQYERNPILLYMHNRGKAIGLIKDIRKENGEITGEPVFDEATELSSQCRKQWDFGSLRMVSIGFEVVETSEDPKHLVPG